MKKDLTEMVFILDRSGSMHGLEEDTVGGFNSLLAKQKEADGQCLVSTVLFNDRSLVLHDRKDLQEVEDLKKEDYQPAGCTALIDALGDAIHHIRNVHRYIREEDVPEHVIFVITTDGLENASRRYSSDEVKKMVREQKEKGWEFLFLGANIDAIETAKHYGIDEDRSVNYISDGQGTRKNFSVLSKAIGSFRENAFLDEDWAVEIEEDYVARK